MKNMKENKSLKQLELEFDKSNQGHKDQKTGAKVINLKDYSKKILTAQALKATKSF